jgi:hypothetical protein
MGCVLFVFGFFALCAVMSQYVSWQVLVGIFIVWCAASAAIGYAIESAKERAKEQSEGLMHFEIYSGAEAYSPAPLAQRERYKVRLTGIDRWQNQGPTQTFLDAAYLFRNGQYSRHQGLLFDGSTPVLFQEDLYHHSFSYAYTGQDRQLSVFLALPKNISEGSSRQALEVRIWKLTAAEEAEVKAVEKKRHEEAEAARQAEEAQMKAQEDTELRRLALDLATRADMEQHLLKPEHQKPYATQHMAEILSTWAERWRKEYLEVRLNEPLYKLIEKQYPLVLEFFRARVEVVRVANALAVAPPTEPSFEACMESQRQAELDQYRATADTIFEKLLERIRTSEKLRARVTELGLDQTGVEELVEELKKALQLTEFKAQREAGRRTKTY